MKKKKTMSENKGQRSGAKAKHVRTKTLKAKGAQKTRGDRYGLTI